MVPERAKPWHDLRATADDLLAQGELLEEQGPHRNLPHGHVGLTPARTSAARNLSLACPKSCAV
jgi:hypothetical protein